MDNQIRLLICLSAAAAANCGPCFQHYYIKAQRINLAEDDIKEAVEIGCQMKTGGNLAMLDNIREIMDQAQQIGTQGHQESEPNPDPTCCG